MRSLVVLFLFAFLTTNAQTTIDSLDVRYLALGDSYTIGESVAVDQRWPVQLKDSLESEGHTFDRFKIIAQTGWTTTNLLNAVDAADLTKDWNLVSILIGVNNQYQNRPFSLFLSELPLLIDKAIALAGNDSSRVFLVSIPDYAYTPFGQSFSNPALISKEIDRYNFSMDSIAEVYQIQFVSITEITRNGLVDKALVAADGLHPSGHAYGQFVKTLLFELKTGKKVTKSDFPEQNGISISTAGSNLIVSLPNNSAQYTVRIYDFTGKELLNRSSLGVSVLLLPLEDYRGMALIVSVFKGSEQLKVVKILQ